MGLSRVAIVMLAIGLAIVSGPARASEQTDVMATVHQFIDGFNHRDRKIMLAACAVQTSIVDEFPPHEWQGTTACADWAKASDADNRAHGVTDPIVTLEHPWHVDVTENNAYVVVPANYAYEEHGKRAVESDSIFTVALHKGAAGWRITGWAWAKH